MGTRVRLFICADIPCETKERINVVVETLKKQKFPIRFYTSEHFHLTLKFIGVVDSSLISSLGKSLKICTEIFSPFKLSLKKLGCSTPPRTGSAIWIEISGDIETLFNLARKIDSSLYKLGIKKDKKLANGLGFTPHITIGRFQKAPYGQIRSAADLINKLELPKLEKEFEIKSISLMQSTLTPKGPIYNPLQNFPL